MDATIKTNVQITVNVPTDWELYSGMPGVRRANAAVTRAALRAAKMIVNAIGKTGANGPESVAEIINAAIAKEITPVFEKFQEFGAYDTEPRGKMITFLNRLAVRTAGLTESERWDCASRLML